MPASLRAPWRRQRSSASAQVGNSSINTRIRPTRTRTSGRRARDLATDPRQDHPFRCFTWNVRNHHRYGAVPKDTKSGREGDRGAPDRRSRYSRGAQSPALRLTAFFKPEEYDGLIEVSDPEAFGMCLRLNREESIIAGPSSGLALAGALKTVPDEPGNVAVVIFPDNVFKYMSSLQRHLPGSSRRRPWIHRRAPAIRLLHTCKPLSISLPRVPMSSTCIAQSSWRKQEFSSLTCAIRRNSLSRDRLRRQPAAADLSKGLTEGLPMDDETPLITICARGKRSVYGLLLLKARAIGT